MSTESESERPPHKSKRSGPVIIDRSPIEFVLVGPKGRDHGILARSKEARIDLIGFAASERDDLELGSVSTFAAIDVVDMFTGSLKLLTFATGSSQNSDRPERRRSMSAVNSAAVQSDQPEADERKQRYRFCWVGECTTEERQTIKNTFDRQLPDIRKALQRFDSETCEWALSSIILECSLGIDNHRQRRIPYERILRLYSRLMVILAVYIVLVFSTVAVIKYVSPTK